jgi:hypothetical protein
MGGRVFTKISDCTSVENQKKVILLFNKDAHSTLNKALQ